jgi:hypothetical protein
VRPIAPAAIILSLSWLPRPLSACEVAIRDAKSAIASISSLFDAHRDRCRYEDGGIQCSIAERAFSTSLSAMPGHVPGYLAILTVSAREKADKDRLSRIFIYHLVDRSPDREIKSRLIKALERGEEFKFSGDTCTVGTSTKDGVTDLIMIGPMSR